MKPWLLQQLVVLSGSKAVCCHQISTYKAYTKWGVSQHLSKISLQRVVVFHVQIKNCWIKNHFQTDI